MFLFQFSEVLIYWQIAILGVEHQYAKTGFANVFTIMLVFSIFTVKLTPMSEQEIILLKTENARLNRMIEALLTANEALGREITILKTGNASPKLGYSLAENDNGITDFGSSVVKNENGITNFGSSVIENENGITSFSSSVAENENGRKGFGSSVVENYKGRTELLPPLPEKIELIGNILITIREKLNTGTHIRVKKSGLRNHAIMLIHFHNGGGGSHPELKKLTGLSDGGLAKSIMSLTKRGLIVRDGFQKFALTPAAKELLKQCLANPIPEWGKKQTPAV